MEISYINDMKIRYMFLENKNEDYKYEVIYYSFDTINNVRKMRKKRINQDKRMAIKINIRNECDCAELTDILFI